MMVVPEMQVNKYKNLNKQFYITLVIISVKKHKHVTVDWYVYI